MLLLRCTAAQYEQDYLPKRLGNWQVNPTIDTKVRHQWQWLFAGKRGCSCCVAAVAAEAARNKRKQDTQGDVVWLVHAVVSFWPHSFLGCTTMLSLAVALCIGGLAGIEAGDHSPYCALLQRMHPAVCATVSAQSPNSSTSAAPCACHIGVNLFHQQYGSAGTRYSTLQQAPKSQDMSFLVDERGHLKKGVRRINNSFRIRLGPADSAPTRWPKVRGCGPAGASHQVD